MLDSLELLLLSMFCVSFVMGHGVSNGLLGELHWCNTLCLCHNETQEVMHCFTDTAIFSLMNLDERKVQRLQSVQFRLDEKLTWCNEVCLCHKNGRKEFKCTNNQSLGEFIRTNTPKLAHYLVPDEEAEIDDLRDHVVEREEDLEHSSEIHSDRKKSKKHRKNKKKKHHERIEEHIETETLSTTTTEATPVEVQQPTTEAQPPQQLNNHDPPKREHSHEHQQNAIVLQASTGSELASNSFGNYPPPSPPLVEVPLERKTIAGKVSKDLAELRENVDHIKADVAMNQHILLVTVAVASVAIIGVFILAIYSCCIRRSTTKHTITKPSRNHCITTQQQQEDNTQTKVNLEEAW